MAPKDISVTISAKDQASAAIKETKKQLGELTDVARDLGKELLAAFGGFARLGVHITGVIENTSAILAENQ